MIIDYDKYAKLIIQEVISRILDSSIIDKEISYSDIAKNINFPKPYTGSQFSGNIGRTLGKVVKY